MHMYGTKENVILLEVDWKENFTVWLKNKKVTTKTSEADAGMRESRLEYTFLGEKWGRVDEVVVERRQPDGGHNVHLRCAESTRRCQLDH